MGEIKSLDKIKERENNLSKTVSGFYIAPSIFRIFEPVKKLIYCLLSDIY